MSMQNMTNADAKDVLNNVWGYANAKTKITADILKSASDVATIALNALDKIKDIIREEEHYEVSTNHPNKVDYDAVAANKFKRIWEVVSEAEELKCVEFKCSLSDEFKDHTHYDEWGAALLWLNEYESVEYNFCIDGELNSSAIYKLYYDESAGTLRTDYSTFEHYEIDFNHTNWKEELKNAMYNTAKKFFKNK